MKKSRITKLALSGAAVAALAATFSTSTYAWYVSNKTANVTAVNGSTASSGASSSISLSVTGQVNDYHKSISLGDRTGNGLNPVVRTGNTLDSTGTVTATYQVLDEANPVNGVVDLNSTPVTTENTYFYEYVFYIKAESACTVRPTITVTNTTTTMPTQINYSGGYVPVTDAEAPTFANGTYYQKNQNGTYTKLSAQPENWSTTYTNYFRADANKVTNVNPGSDFTVDALYSTYMSLGVINGKAYEGDISEFTNAASPTVLNYTGPVTPSTASDYMKYNLANTGDLQVATAGAQTYYEGITGTTLSAAAKNTYTGTGFTTLSLTANTPLKLVYHLWLDGSDDQCFNACAGQTFSVAFDFVVTSSN